MKATITVATESAPASRIHATRVSGRRSTSTSPTQAGVPMPTHERDGRPRVLRDVGAAGLGDRRDDDARDEEGERRDRHGDGERAGEAGHAAILSHRGPLTTVLALKASGMDAAEAGYASVRRGRFVRAFVLGLGFLLAAAMPAAAASPSARVWVPQPAVVPAPADGRLGLRRGRSLHLRRPAGGPDRLPAAALLDRPRPQGDPAAAAPGARAQPAAEGDRHALEPARVEDEAVAGRRAAVRRASTRASCRSRGRARSRRSRSTPGTGPTTLCIRSGSG